MGRKTTRSTRPSDFRPLVRLLLAAAALLFVATPLHAFTFAIRGDGEATERPAVPERPDTLYLTSEQWRAGGTEGWFPWPLVHWQRGPEESLHALHPLFSTAAYREGDEVRTDILWPVVRWRYRGETPAFRRRIALHAFLVWFSGRGEDSTGTHFHDRFLFPLYWQGGRETGERYFVLFPFVWYANGARVQVPVFPPRPQRFAALWPLMGNFEGFWNRDRVRFVLWPIFVQSSVGAPGEDDRVVTTSIVWPITGIHRGPKTSGFRLWPLFSRVHRKEEFTRAYWLWPLGHYRSEEPSVELPEGRDVTLFFPFYGSWRDHLMRYRLVFPFYGRLEMRGRRSRGYLLAIYNEHDRYRSGVREHRLLWLIVRWTSRIEVPDDFLDSVTGRPLERPRTGGGVFPIYVSTRTDTNRRTTVLWPIGHRIVDEYDDYTFRRLYILPLYGAQTKDFADEREAHRRFFVPFYRTIRHEDGWRYQSAPHLFPYAESDPLDRNWAPVWTVWSKEAHEETGALRVRVLGNVWQNDRYKDGAARKRLDLFFFRTERSVDPEGERSHRTRLLFGLVERRGGDGGGQWRLLGKRL